MSFPDMNPQTVVANLYSDAVNLIEATDQQYIIWKAPKACEITGIWSCLDAAVGAGTLQLTILDRGTSGTATASTMATHGTATAYAAQTPATETISEGTLDDGDYVSVQLENEASGTTVSIQGLTVGLEYVLGIPAAES